MNQMSTEEALRESRRKLATLLSNLPGMSYRCLNDNNWTMEFISNGSTALTGFSPEELTNNSRVAYNDVIHTEDRSLVWDAVQHGLENRAPFKIEYRIVTKDGKEKWVWEQGCGIYNDQDELLAIEGFITDITARIRAEEEKALLRRQLFDSQKMEAIGRLAGGIAHDFNNYLTAIGGHTELAMMMTLPEDEIYTSLREVFETTYRASELTRQLLTFSRKQIVEPKVLDTNSVIVNMYNMLNSFLDDNISLELTLTPDIPTIKIDPTQFDQVVINLVVNARDALRMGGQISISTQYTNVGEQIRKNKIEQVEGEFVCVTVEDNGTGMSKDVQNRIFEPFFTTKSEGEGTGLGLPTVFGIVNQNKGFLSVYSEEGLGTTFKIYFPATEEIPTDVEPSKNIITAIEGNETILIAEDNHAVRSMVVSSLQRFGYTVADAPDGLQAIELIKNGLKPDIVVTDVVMPNMTGPEMASIICKTHPNLPILFTSAFSLENISDHGFLGQSVEFIGKPFRPLNLARKIRTILEKQDNQ